MKSWLENNDIEMYSTHNERKSVVERFTRTLTNKIYKYMTSVSKNVHIDKLDDIVNKYNNTYYKTIKMKPADVKLSTYIDSSKEILKVLNLKLVIYLEYQNTKTFLQKAMSQVGLKKYLWLKKLKILFHGHTLLVILKEKKLLERLGKRHFKKQIKEFRIEKVIKRKGDKLYFKWKKYNNLLNPNLGGGNFTPPSPPVGFPLITQKQ